MDVDISAVICTHNRAAYLDRAIRSLINQTLEKASYEVVIVDNASTDDTASIVDHIEPQGIQMRYVYEAQLGLSRARNAGIVAACGEIIAFMDDDAWATPEWLAALLRTYQENPDAWAVGGRTLPDWEASRPGWFVDDFLPYLSIVNWGDAVRRLKWPEFMVGTNCSFRRQVFAEVGGFSTELGRRGAALLGAEETELQLRLHRAGRPIFYQPAAVVYHTVPESRVTQAYMRGRAYWGGVSDSIAEHAIEKIGAGRILRRILRRIGWMPILHLFSAWIRGDVGHRLVYECSLLASLGSIQQELSFLVGGGPLK